jgi:hypothetical protein
VACIRTDASPNEVLHHQWTPTNGGCQGEIQLIGRLSFQHRAMGLSINAMGHCGGLRSRVRARTAVSIR